MIALGLTFEPLSVKEPDWISQLGGSLYYVNVVRRSHDCWGSCGQKLKQGEIEIRFRYPDSNSSVGCHVQCFYEKMQNDLERLGEVLARIENTN